MRTLDVNKIRLLQKDPANIRNICILAHVDHGKTTLADALVASNGIISQRMAGKLRYLDSREDEQIRGITMKSSAISLIFNKGETETLINLIDSPGHIDFSSEVSTAVRLCDGAIVLVDVVEGVCPQTHAVLRQAWLEDIRPVLILNKMDRLITELKMSPVEAHLHLQQILEQVNAITAELFASEVMEKTSDQVESQTKQVNQQAKLDDKVFDWSSGLEETDDSHLYFSPGESNVIFTSAIDGWGFGINEFAELYAKKLGLNAQVLQKTLWGDFYLDTKTKRIRQGAMAKGKKPLFVQFILENLWAVYEAVMENKDKEKIEKIVKSLNLKIPPRDARHSDPRVQLQAICSQWMPLSRAVLAMVVSKLPSPLELEPGRAEKLLCSRSRRFDTLPQNTQALKDDFLACSDADSAPVIVYVSKLFTIEKKHLPQHRQRPLTQEEIIKRRELARQRHLEKMAETTENETKSGNTPTSTERVPESSELIIQTPTEKENLEDQVFIAFARIFSGTIRKGQKLYVLGPKYDPAKAAINEEESRRYVSEFEADDLYLFMGRELEALEEISAGNIIGLGGVEEHILKSATISSSLACPAFTDMYFEASPIVRVAVEPVNAGDLGALARGLKLLNQADPSVEIQILETGEHVILAAGEVHLQKCLDDLQKSFAKVEVNTSAPNVPFRETIIPLPKFDRLNEAIMDQNPSVLRRGEGEEEGEEEDEDEEILEDGAVEIQTANRLCGLKLRALPLPKEVIQLLEEYSDVIKELDKIFSSKIAEKSDKISPSINAQTRTELLKLKDLLEKAFQSDSDEDNNWENIVEQIWCFGPRRNGPNMLVNRIKDYDRPSIWSCLSETSNGKRNLRQYDYCVVSGFQMATLSGPLCEESMHGVCFLLESWEHYDKALSMKERRSLNSGVDSTKSDSMKTVDSSSSLKSRGEGTCKSGNGSQSTADSDSNKVANQDDGQLENNVKSEEGNIEHLSTQMHKDLNINSDSSVGKVSHDQTSKDLGINSMESDNCDSTAMRDVPVKTSDIAASPASPVSPGSPGWCAGPKEVYGPFSGQLMSCMKQGCRRAFQAQPQRLMWAMYTCVVQATAEVLGKMYGVLSKRHGRVLGEEMKEGSSIFNINAVLPVVESFGFAEEIRKRTSGLASPQLRFSHWEVIELDPFWVPTTEEEYLHFGEKADSENVARNYMNSVRRRKGLHTDDKLVEFGEKQRTLTRNK